MKLTIKTAAILVPAIFAAGILAASLLGYWKTTSTKVPVAIKEGEFAGLPNPSDIRGSYTWSDVAEAFDFDVALALEAFGATDPAQKVNTLETIYGEAGLPEGLEIGTDSVRLFVSLLTGIPHVPEEGTILPGSALPVLREYGKADKAAIEAAAARAFGLSASVLPLGASTAVAEAAAPATAPAPVQKTPDATQATVSTTPNTPATTVSPVVAVAEPAKNSSASDTTVEHTQTPGTVTGKTTFGDVKAWGLTEEQILKASGGDRGPDSAAIRDWATAKGLSFSEIKTALQAALAEK